MRKLLLLLIVLSSIAASSQQWSLPVSNHQRIAGLWAERRLKLPADTAFTKEAGCVTLINGVLYVADGTKWNTYASGGGSSAGVSSFDGRFGAVVPQTGDYTINMITGGLDSIRRRVDSIWVSGGSIFVRKGSNQNSFPISVDWPSGYPTYDGRYPSITRFLDTSANIWSRVQSTYQVAQANYSTTYALSNDLRDTLGNRYTKAQSDARYLQSFTESDPVWTAAAANYYTKTQADARYLQSFTETDPTVYAWAKAATKPAYAVAEITGLQTALDGKQNVLGFTPENAANKGVANGFAALGSDSKILAYQLPQVAINQTFTVNSQSAMLALSANQGDIAVRTDQNKAYILAFTGASTLSNWIALPGVSNEADPVFTASVAYGITGTNVSNWNNAFGWGNHAGLYRPVSWVPAWTDVTGRPTALSQFTNDLGNYGGWITGINSTMVTTALGYTPYNSSNPAGYITSSALSSYLPLSGGTLTGAVLGTSAEFSTGIGTEGMGRFKGWYSSGTGAAAEVGTFGGSAYLFAYDRTASAYIPAQIRGSEIKLNIGGTDALTVTATGTVNIQSTNQALRVNGGSYGNSGGNYHTHGYNVGFTSTGDVWTYLASDFASFIRYQSGGFQFYTAPSGTAGATMSPTLRYTLDVNGNNTWTGNGNFGGSIAGMSGSFSGTGVGLFNAQINTINTTSSPALISFQNTANGFAFGFSSTGTQRFVFINGGFSEIASITGTGAATFSGLGTFNSNLLVTASAHPNITINAPTDNFAQLIYNENGSLKWNAYNDFATDNYVLGNSGGARFVLTQTGSLGVSELLSIGTTTTLSERALRVYRSGTSYIAIQNDATGLTASDGATIGYFSGDQVLGIGNREPAAMDFFTNNAAASLRITQSGRILMGPASLPTDNGTSALQINGSILATSFNGSGSGLTGVPWASITGAPSFLTTAVTSATGTANQITVSASTGAVTFSLPSAVAIGSLSLSSTTASSSTTTGALTVAGGLGVGGAIHASGGFFNSDKRWKNIEQRISASSGIDAVKWTWNASHQVDYREHWGYVAQEVLKVLPEAVSMSAEGFYSVEYNSVFTYKIAMLEKRVADLEKKATLTDWLTEKVLQLQLQVINLQFPQKSNRK